MAIFGPQGIRDAMTKSYHKHVRELTGKTLPDGTSLHHAALYGALATRYIVGGEPTMEAVVWAELAPFLNLPPDEGLAALAEYVVYKEMSNRAGIATLSEQIARGLSLLPKRDREAFGTMAEINGIAWLPLTQRGDAVHRGMQWVQSFARGISNLKAAPSRYDVSNSIRPPALLIRSRQMLSPKPVPVEPDESSSCS